MRNEIAPLKVNNTWTLKPLPEGKKPIDYHWGYKIKYKADGTLERYKARLVVKGFTQVKGFDFHENFTLIAKLVSIRVFLQWLLHDDGNCIRWILTPFCMATLMRKFT
ncbi:UNVERIFIED_CONTAM: Retrovirus-related Pol polyprotein from transposon RE1 [Sesamum latifolium]|uniref:Retrovirus-related Pol polyprotein from transposon RE1 n=1 Tax=Sesamum latifolium TaxID=2727402 RepID=A0AAW2TL38_9LAMI